MISFETPISRERGVTSRVHGGVLAATSAATKSDGWKVRA